MNNLKLEYWEPTKLIGYIKNPRKNDQVIQRMVESISEFGFTIPVLAKSDGSVIDGHLRLKAAIKMKMEQVPVVIADHLSESQIKAFRLLANRSANWAEWDEDLLKIELLDLKKSDFDLSLTGFDTKELDQLLVSDESSSIQEDEVSEVPSETTIKTGDLFILGQHRVLCGDNSDPENVKRLLKGEVPDACISDPPYGINFDTDYTRFTIQSGKNNKYKPIHNDHQLFDPRPYLHYESVVLWGANYFAEHLPFGTWLIWDKRFENGKAWLSDAEVAWMKTGTGVYIKSITSQGFVRPEKVEHPTQKPIELMAWCMEKSKSGNLIFDPFLGSGTTLMAAEQLGKRCVGMEIEPTYVQVILDRWEKLSGQKAVLELSDG